LGWATITHPFHPLHGQHFEILKTRKVSGIETLILRHPEKGSHAVPREWTDQADPDLCDLLNLPPSKLRIESLQELAELLRLLDKPLQIEVDQ
jgi:hypothetical protein